MQVQQLREVIKRKGQVFIMNLPGFITDAGEIHIIYFLYLTRLSGL